MVSLRPSISILRAGRWPLDASPFLSKMRENDLPDCGPSWSTIVSLDNEGYLSLKNFATALDLRPKTIIFSSPSFFGRSLLLLQCIILLYLPYVPVPGDQISSRLTRREQNDMRRTSRNSYRVSPCWNFGHLPFASSGRSGTRTSFLDVDFFDDTVRSSLVHETIRNG